MEFNKSLATKLLTYAERSYSQLTWKWKTDGFLLELDSNGDQILAFPGSEQLGDWLNDIEFVKVKREGLGNIHIGFASTLDCVKPELIKMLDKNKILYITGHSLAGATSILVALALFNLGYKIEAIYTFGCPRVGDWLWADNFNKSGIKHYRIKNGNDPVCSVPKLFFYHVGEEIHINKRGVFSWFFKNVLDHKIENYYDGLRNYEKT